MPARLLIVDDAATEPVDRWIERPFLTIGSDAGSDVPLAAPDGEPLAVYLQFRDGRYEVFNKQAGEVVLAGRPVAPGRSAAWEPGTELVVGGRRLRLVVEGDPAPGPRPIAAAKRPAPPAASDVADRRAAVTQEPRDSDAGPPRDRGRGLKMGVIFACLVACVLMLARDQLPSAAAGPTDPDTFAALVDEAFADGQAAAAGPADGTRRRLARRLQWAESAWLAGDRPVAAERFAALKRHLDGSRLAPAAGAEKNGDDWRRRLADHVDRRMTELSRR